MTEAALALLPRQGRWFVQRRAAANPELPGLWEFPGGKLEPGEPPEAALCRELREEVGVSVWAVQPLPVIEGSVRLHPFIVQIEGDPRTPLAWGWFTAAELLRLPLPPANAALVRMLAQRPEVRIH